MVQFTENDKEVNDLYVNESVQHKDQIVAICILLIVQIATNKKTKFGTQDNDLDVPEKPGLPSEKLRVIQKIKENIEKNSILLNSSYLTLVMLAFRRDSLISREIDVIPTITEVLDVIKQKDQVRNKNNQ